MKKITVFLNAVLLCLGIAFFSVGAAECAEFEGGNVSSQNYSLWSSPVESHLVLVDDGRLMRVQYLPENGGMLIEYYDSLYNLLSRKYIETDLPIYGGFFDGGDAYYLLTGQINRAESDSTEVFRITKYDKSWNKISHAGLYGANTTVPFDAGSARFHKSGKYIIIRTGHEMYRTSDGLNHQANVTIQLDSEKMEITDSYTDIMNTNYGYVSHSFNQFVKIENDKIIALDHGDAHPRSIVLLKYKTNVSSGKFVPSYYNACEAVDMLKIAGNTGDNYTNCSVGGFEISSTSYLAAITSIEQGSSSKAKNIYVSVLEKNSTSPTLKKLTNYTDTDPQPSTPHLVKTASDRFMIMWEKGESVYYGELDKQANLIGNIHSLVGSLSDCVPVISGDKLVWYVWSENEVTFYEISLNSLENSRKTTVNSSHSFEIAFASGSEVTLKCTKCSETKKGSVPSSFSIWWFIKDGDGYYSSAHDSAYHPGDKTPLWVRFDAADYNEYELISSNQKAVKISYDYYGDPVAEMIGEGTSKITVRSKYSPEISKSYTVRVSHSWCEDVTKPTCTQEGKTVKVCSVCGERVTETISAAGHKMASPEIVKKATCTASGKQTVKCENCDYTESAVIDKLPHNDKTTIKAVSATCTKSGKTEGKKCSMCGKMTLEQETVPAHGHNMGDYETVKEPTCTAQGKKTAKCSRCGEEDSEAIAKTDHDEKTIIKAVSATCTKSGKTEGKKCSMCGKVALEQETIPALGHNMGDYETEKEPTCTTQGEKAAKCSRCDKSETESIAKLGHSYSEYGITKQATCTAMGEKTAYCVRCEKTVTDDIPRLSHEEKTMQAEEATCTKGGKTSGTSCARCGRVLKEPETTPKLGHDIKATVITKATKENHGEILEECARCGDAENSRVYMIKTVKAAKSRYAYDGKTPKVSVRVIDSQKNALKEGEDYTVSIVGSEKRVGTHTAKITFKGKYSGSGRVSFDIVPGKTAKITASESTSYIKLTWSEVKGATGYRVYQYNSKAKKYENIASVKGGNSYTVKNLKSGTAYKFYVKAYTKLADGKVYWGSAVKAEFATKPGKAAIKVTSTTKKTAQLSWDKISGATGYQVYYSTSKKGDYKKLKSTSAVSYKKTGLTSGKTYYFKVRAYKKAGGKVIYGQFSDIKSVKIR